MSDRYANLIPVDGIDLPERFVMSINSDFSRSTTAFICVGVARSISAGPVGDGYATVFWKRIDRSDSPAGNRSDSCGQKDRKESRWPVYAGTTLLKYRPGVMPIALNGNWKGPLIRPPGFRVRIQLLST
ncbi:MAG: hypothetical protein KDA91_00970 [Planctomycetaceae bacterium]|nr:hypothetical protein [Planctomycetaceae bacterium]